MTGTEPTTEEPTFRILVVDDNRDAADTLCMLLRAWGFEGQVAYDGTAGLAAAHAYRPDCMVMDIELPGIGGYELARRVRGDESLRGRTLVAMTVREDQSREKRSR
jgi:CheY-like chemotaxis protein